MFVATGKHEKADCQSDLEHFWCLGKNHDVMIERVVHIYPISKDEVNYERLIKILSMYRIIMGQARQEELIEYMFNEFDNAEELKHLFINLSPFCKREKKLRFLLI